MRSTRSILSMTIAGVVATLVAAQACGGSSSDAGSSGRGAGDAGHAPAMMPAEWFAVPGQ